MKSKTKSKDPLERTKVVIRRLPPSLSQSLLFSRFDPLFSHRYNWSSFSPGNEKRKKHSRAYIDFKNPEDVFEFFEFFHGHLFVTDKGAHFKAIVEYAPSQRVPNPCAFKDGREGTIYKDSEYLEFLKHIAKPVESLPSVDIQLETKEVEQPGPIVTPLMEFVRQKRAAQDATQGSSPAFQLKKLDDPSRASASSSSTKRATDKKKSIRKGVKNNSSQNGKSTIRNGKELPEMGSGYVKQFRLTGDSGKKRILLQKGKKLASSPGSEVVIQQSDLSSSGSNSPASKKNLMHETSGRLIRGILTRNEAHQNQSLSVFHGKKESQDVNLENARQPQWHRNANANSHGHVPNMESFPRNDANRSSDLKITNKDWHHLRKDHKDKGPARKGDGQDPSVLTRLRHLDVQHGHEAKLSDAVFERQSSNSNNVKDALVEIKTDMHYRANTGRVPGNFIGNHNSSAKAERKFSNRGFTTNYAASQKKVWVLKSSPDS